MICGVLLPNKEEEWIVWTRSGGIHLISDDCQKTIDKTRVGEWIDCSMVNGIVEDFTIHDPATSGGRVSRAKNGKIQFLATIMVPTDEESEQIGWAEPAVHCTFFGKVYTSGQFLWDLRSRNLSTGCELWIDWDPKIEVFFLPSQAIKPAPWRTFFGKAYIPWKLENTIELNWQFGVISARTNHSCFVATKFGDFVLSAASERLGAQPPTVGCYLKCNLRERKFENSEHNAGEVLAYEVLPMPDDCQIYRLPANGLFCMFRCQADIVGFRQPSTRRGPILYNTTLRAVHDDENLIKNPELGKFYDLIVRRPKDDVLFQFDYGWKVVKVMGMMESLEVNLQTFARESNEAEFRGSTHGNITHLRDFSPDLRENNRRYITKSEPFDHGHAHDFDSALPVMELRGIVTNQIRGLSFISFSMMEASYHIKDARKNNMAPLKLGDHLLCVVKDLETIDENKTQRCEILNYRVVPSPAGWGIAGQSPSGLARIICPLRFLCLSSHRPKLKPYRYPIYCNELMEIVHDYDMRTLEYGEEPNLERLKYLKLKAEVTWTRIPGGGGQSGILLHRVIEKHFEIEIHDDSLIDEPSPSLDQYLTPVQERESHSENYNMGFVVKKWGFFLVVWLIDRRLATIDTRNFHVEEVPKLGTFIECDTIAIDAPILDQKMVYKWEITEFKSYRLDHCEGIVEDSKAMVLCRDLIFESIRLLEKKRQAQFSHPFFGSICDKQGIFTLAPEPGDLVEAYIKAIPQDESTLQWIIAEPKVKERLPKKFPPRAVVAPMNHTETTDEYEDAENDFTKLSEGYLNFDAQSTSTYGTNEEVTQINSRGIVQSSNKNVPPLTDGRRAKTYEELVTRIVEHPEISRVVLDVNPDLFAEIVSMNL